MLIHTYNAYNYLYIKKKMIYILIIYTLFPPFWTYKYLCTEVCPSGKAFVDIPTASNRAHAFGECSNAGLCERTTGTCQCFPPYIGAACERLGCPNGCSGHGQCLSMSELAIVGMLASPSYTVAYGELGYEVRIILYM